MIGRPELVFLDEPTAGLDPQARHATWELIESLRAAGAAVILATHYMEEAERLADQIVIVDHGQVVAERHPARAVRVRRASSGSAPSPGLDLDGAGRGAAGGQRGRRSRRPGTTWSRCATGSTRGWWPR